MKSSGWLAAVGIAATFVGCGGRSTHQDGDNGSGVGGSAAGDVGGTPPSGGSGGSATLPAGQGGGAGSSTAGGDGGRSGSSGTAGAAGAAGAAGRGPCGPLIDDMEDGTGRICPGAGRIGVWYAYNDGFGVQSPAPTTPGVPILPVPIPNGRNGSTRAMFSSFAYPTMLPTEGTLWGAGIGVDLAFDGTTYRSYDGSAYDGITFFARSSTFVNCLVRISTTASTLVDYGGSCPEEFCNPYELRVYFGPDWEIGRASCRERG